MLNSGIKRKSVKESEANGCFSQVMSNISENKYDTAAIKDWLLEFREREKDIKWQLDRLDIIEMRLGSIGSPSISDTPKSSSPSQDRNAYMIAVKIDLENEIKEQQEKQRRTREEIEKIVHKLRKAEERSVIRARYLDCAFFHGDKLSDWNDVSNMLFGDKSDFLEKEDSYLRRTHKIHGTALQNMARCIQENPEHKILVNN